MRALVPLAALVLAACGGAQVYQSDGAKNLTVRTELREVTAALHVHEVVGADCKTNYRGVIPLDRPEVELAMPSTRLVYLVVRFDGSSFLGGSRAISTGTLVEPRPGYRYELRVRYFNKIYDVALSEIDRKGASRELPRRSC